MMERVPQRLAVWWGGLNPQRRITASGIAFCGLLYTVHYLVYCIPQPFFIEDAAITFAYAKHLVEGHGLVTYPGGERVEGYSNATWTLLMAGIYATGLPMWTGSKVLGWLLGLLTLPFAWSLTRRALPINPEWTIDRGTLALLTPLFMAAYLPFALWNASGLENSLFVFLLTWGLARLIKEVEDGGRPWSALIFAVLCMSRPDGIMYATIAGFARLLAVFSPMGEESHRSLGRRLATLSGWLLLLAMPLVAYHSWRIWYFAWEFPNTFYAKLGTGKVFKPYTWDRRGWKYLKTWYQMHGTVGAIPFIVLAMTGLRSKRRWVPGLLWVLVLAVVIFWNGRAGLPDMPDWWSPIPRDWNKIRAWTIGATAPLLAISTIGRSGWRARSVLWACFASGMFFVLYVGGDWMKAHRWMSLITVPTIAIIVVGIVEVAMRIAGPLRPVLQGFGWRAWLGPLRTRWAAAMLVLGVLSTAWFVNEIRLIIWFAGNPETTVRDINRRVKYMSWVQKRLDMDHVTLLDVDMGAHMYFSGWDIVDIAGLVDVPMAQHSDFNMKFVKEYLFEERKPDFAHVHAGWARSSRIPKHKEWKEGYIEVPGYPIGRRKLHIGNHIRKGIFVNSDDERPALARFEGAIELVEWSVPSPVIQPGSELHIELGFRARSRKDGFRILAILDDGQGQRTVAVVPPGYDWYPPEDWKRKEMVAGRYQVHIPKHLAKGQYSLSIVLMDEVSGGVLAVKGSEGQPLDLDPNIPANAYLPGGFTLDVQVEVAGRSRVNAAAGAALQSALAAAQNDECEAIWGLWKNAKRHVPFRKSWHARHIAEVEAAQVQCYVSRFDGSDDRGVQVAALSAATDVDPQDRALVARARPLALVLDAEGDALWEAGELDAAYSAFSQALDLNAHLSRTRRKAEDVRDLRLDIVRPSRKEKR
jgi:hypothetical protein